MFPGEPRIDQRPQRPVQARSCRDRRSRCGAAGTGPAATAPRSTYLSRTTTSPERLFPPPLFGERRRELLGGEAPVLTRSSPSFDWRRWRSRTERSWLPRDDSSARPECGRAACRSSPWLCRRSAFWTPSGGSPGPRASRISPSRRLAPWRGALLRRVEDLFACAACCRSSSAAEVPFVPLFIVFFESNGPARPRRLPTLRLDGGKCSGIVARRGRFSVTGTFLSAGDDP